MSRRRNQQIASLFCFALLFVMGTTAFSFGDAGLVANRNFPNTNAVLSDLDSISRSIAQTDRQLKELRKTIQSARTNVKNAASLTKKVGEVERKIERIRREVDSLSRIPQLRMFKAIASGLKSMGSKVKAVRRKADSLRKTKLDPASKKLSDLDSEVRSAQRKLSGVSLQVRSARAQLASYRDRVVRNGSRRLEVAAVETAARAAKGPVSELKSVVADIAGIVTKVQSQVSQIRTVTSTINRYGSGVSKVERKLDPIDKKAKSVKKVMDKSISFKIPFKKKRVTVSVRKVLSAPGDVLKVAVKPLTAIAKKLLKPLTSKIRFDVKAPKELQQLSQALDSLQRIRFDVSSQVHQLKSKVRKMDSATIKNALSKLARLS